MIDPELAALLDFMPVIELDDPVAARRAFEKLLVSMRTPLPEADLLEIDDRMIPGWEDDPEVSVRVYRPKATAATGEAVPGIVLIHGGGFIVGSVEAEHVGAVLMAVDAGAVLVSVDYRLAPEHPYPAGLHDCFAALSFLHAEAGALGVDPARIALVGTSAGGGLAAATALLARDRGGPAICFQMLHIPELDDRLETPSMREFVDAPVWNTPLAVQSWKAYLGDLAGSADIPVYAAPARATDLAGCRRPTSRPRRTIRCATRASPTRWPCCGPGCRSSCTSSPGPSTARRWWPGRPCRAGPRRRRPPSCGAPLGWPRNNAR